MSKHKTYALIAGSFAAGYLVSYLRTAPASFENTSHTLWTTKIMPNTLGQKIKENLPAKSADHPQVSQKSAGNESQYGASVDPTFRVPSSVTNIIIPSLLQNNDSQISDLSILPYGLPLKEVTRLGGFLNSKASQVAELEAENSEIITDSEGNQFIKIKPFSESGRKLRAEIEAEIDKTFSAFDDDRASIFKQQLFKTILYDDFGENDREISIDDAVGPTGVTGQVFTISRYSKGNLVSRRSDQWSLSLMNGRFKSILKKHQDKLIP